MIDFIGVQNSVRELKRQLAAAEIDEKTFEDRLLEMIDYAEDGYYWMYGHESENWFRYDGERWVPADPSQIKPVHAQRDGADQQDDSVSVDQLPVNMAWFMISLFFIVAVGCVIYISGLV